VLYRLPEWCVYISAPGVPNFFAYLDWSLGDLFAELHLLMLPPENQIIQLDLRQPTIDLAIKSVLSDAERIADLMDVRLENIPPNYVDIQSTAAAPMINLVLYLCAENADLGADRPGRPRPKRTKKGWRMFPPDKPRVWDVGVRIGAALRAAHLAGQTEQVTERTESGRQSPRPHVRRAHWHTYRTGEGRTGSTLKWLPPIAVKIEDGDIVPVIRMVKK
jgi:hypothetical protein